MTNSPLFTNRLDSHGGQAIRRLAQRLAAYLPATVTRQILNDSLTSPGEARWINAATLFADLSGFTTMTEALAVDGPRGAEELNRTLLMTFTPLINAIHDAGGAVSHFHGDAMMVYFWDNDGRASSRALACARFMQSLMLTSLAQVTAKRAREQAATFTLTMKIGVGYGRCLELIVGDPAERLEFVLGGTAVDEAVTAQELAAAGQVIASRSALQQAGLPAETPFRPLNELAPVPGMQPLFYWETFDQPALERLLAVAPAFMPRALFERLQNPDTQFVAEHRPVTSLFVRFQGIDYTAADAGQKLQAYYQWVRETVQQYSSGNGHVNRILTGDKGSQLHILFGAPVAPDAPAQAVRCALALQAARPAFIYEQQIGISAGRVFACAVGSQHRREYTVVGSVVNLSSRLTSYAAPGDILLDARTAQRVQEQFTLDALPPVILKGHTDPVAVYRVVDGQRSVPRRKVLPGLFERDVRPPLGRDEELKQLLACIEGALQGNGGVTALFGPFGSGQAPLLAAGSRRWLDAGGRRLTAMCQPQLAEAPFAPWQTILRELLDITAVSGGNAETAVRQKIAALCPSCVPDVPLLVDMLGLSAAGEGGEVLPADARRERLFRVIRRFLLAAAAQAPLLLIFEDLHWADQVTLELIDDLAAAIVQAPVLLALTYRTSSDFRPPAFYRANFWSIPLQDLSPEKARRLLLTILGTDDLPQLVEQRLGLRDRQGHSSPVNPLFLEESLKMMLASGGLRVETAEDGRQRVVVQEQALLQMQLPDTIYNVLLARLDQLPAPARSLAQVAAVIGRVFDLEMLLAVAPGMSPDEVAAALEALVRAEMVQQMTAVPHPSYIFQHALTHDVVYQSLPYARRRALHAAIAELIVLRGEGNLRPHYPLLAYHYGQTDAHEEGLQYALAAADDAAAIFANQEAADLYRQAAAHVTALGEAAYWQTAVHIYTARARVLRLMGEYTKAMLAATEALKLCLVYGKVEQTLPIYNHLAEIRYHQARYNEVEALVGKVIHNLGGQTPPAELAQAYLLAGMAAAAVMEPDQALARLERAEEICLAMEDRQRLISVWGAMAGVYAERQWELGLETAVRAVELARQQELPAQEALANYRLSRIQLQAGMFTAALQSVQQALVLVRGASHNLRAHILTHRAAVFIYAGRLEAAVADLQEAVDLLGKMDDAPGLMQAYLLWGFEYCHSTRDWQESRRRLAQVGQIVASEETSRMYVQEAARLWLGLGIVAFHLEHFAQAETLFQRGMHIIESRRLRWWRPTALYWLGRVSMESRDKQSEAAHYFRRAIRAIHDGGSPDDLPLILLHYARLTPGEMQWELLEACVAAAFRRARFIDRMRCLREAGERLLAAEEPRLRRLGGCSLAWVEAHQSVNGAFSAKSTDDSQV